MPPKGYRGKEGKGKATSTLVTEPIQSELPKTEADWNSIQTEKAKRICKIIAFIEQEEDIIEFLIRSEVPYSNEYH